MFSGQMPNNKEGESRQASIRIDNVGRELIQWIEQSRGGRGARMRYMQVVRPPEGSTDDSEIELEVTLGVGVAEITNEFVNITLTGRATFGRPSILLRHDPDSSPGLF